MNIKEVMSTVPEFTKFTYWFVKDEPNSWSVFEIATQTRIGSLFNGTFVDDGPIDADDAQRQMIATAVEIDWNNFQTRPEYYMTELKLYPQATMEEMRSMYNIRMIGCALTRARKGKITDVDYLAEKLEPMFNWLENSGFYTGPSSTQYHDAFPGGNLYHHLLAMDQGVELWKLPVWNRQVKVEDVVFVIGVHDWCKIDAYESYTKKMPDEKGNWVPTLCYKYKDNLIPLGHGVSSMFLASRFFKLSPVEALAIRWHMGAYRCVESETHEMYQACEKYPLVFITQFADQLATTKYAQVRSDESNG